MSKGTKLTVAEAAGAVEDIYRPILRGYFAVFAAYYFVMLPMDWATLQGMDLVWLFSASLIAGCHGIFGVWLMRKQAPSHQVELVLMLMNILVILNILIALAIEFAPEKLVYLIISALVFAFASVNFRQAATSVIMAGAALLWFLPRLDAATFSVYAFLAFAATMASCAIAFYLRRAIERVAEAKIEAEKRLQQSELAAAEMRRNALSDSLTKLPNRRAFFSFLPEAVERTKARRAAGESNAEIWLIVLDLDGFKAVNDIHGHLTGDLLLKQVAGRLAEFGGDDTHVSRMGGDEFNIVIESDATERQIIERCERLLTILSREYLIEGRSIRVFASMGCKRMDLNASSKSELSLADYALIVAKKQGRNRVVLFNQRHALQARNRFQIEEALRSADLKTEMHILFQPQVELATNAVICAEVLARWNNPMVGEIGPDQFIRIAEESGLIAGMTLVVIEKALGEMHGWARHLPISINLSAQDIMTDEMVSKIKALVTQSGINPALIEFEVTETAMMTDFVKASANLRALAAFGFTIALDDFGTGYANFSSLRALPISKLKIDRSFLDNPGDPMTEKVLATLSQMAGVLGVQCLFEGVENELELLMAKRSGAQAVQGYYFGKPMTGGELLAMLQDDTSARMRKLA